MKFFSIEKNNTIHSTKRTSAFTLVEAMVAISVLMVAVVSPLTIAQKGLSSAVYSKDQMVASYLAQDAIEIIKNMRDSSVKDGSDWLSSFVDGGESCIQQDNLNEIKKICIVDMIPTPHVQSSTVGNKTDLYIVTDGDDRFLYYTHGQVSGAVLSKFKREVNIRNASGKNEAIITVRVYWNTGVSDNSVEIKTYIYNLGLGGVNP